MRSLMIAIVVLGATPTLAKADPCAGLSGYDYHHCSTAVQGDQAVRDHWASLTPREREVTRLANAAVSAFRETHGRFPTPRDLDWTRALGRRAGVGSRAEAEFMAGAIESAIRGTRELAGIERDMCAAARMYADMGFGHIYRGVMPECF